MYKLIHKSTRGVQTITRANPNDLRNLMESSPSNDSFSGEIFTTIRSIVFAREVAIKT